MMRLRKTLLVLGLVVVLLAGAALAAEFWGSVKSDKFHYPDCVYARKIKVENRVVFHSLEAALKAGYVPCKACKPDEPE